MDPFLQLPKFKNNELLKQSLTHSSFARENGVEDNERLEFLGDSILGMIAAEFLYMKYPGKDEGYLTSLRSSLVDQRQLSNYAKILDIGRLLRLGKGADKENCRSNDNILSCAFEALIGAYYIDQSLDFKSVKKYVEPLFDMAIQEDGNNLTYNFKGMFQEWAITALGTNPTYQIISEKGPDHAKSFTVEVKVWDETYGIGSGRSKRDAEKEAAQNALLFTQSKNFLQYQL